MNRKTKKVMTTIRNIKKCNNYDQNGKGNDDDQEYKKM